MYIHRLDCDNVYNSVVLFSGGPSVDAQNWSSHALLQMGDEAREACWLLHSSSSPQMLSQVVLFGRQEMARPCLHTKIARSPTDCALEAVGWPIGPSALAPWNSLDAFSKINISNQIVSPAMTTTSYLLLRRYDGDANAQSNTRKDNHHKGQVHHITCHQGMENSEEAQFFILARLRRFIQHQTKSMASWTWDLGAGGLPKVELIEAPAESSGAKGRNNWVTESSKSTNRKMQQDRKRANALPGQNCPMCSRCLLCLSSKLSRQAQSQRDKCRLQISCSLHSKPSQPNG